MARCVFCQILDGATEADVVFDEPQVAGFLDHRPLFAGHVLVVPRRHVPNLDELPADLIHPLFRAVQRTAAAVESALGADGTFVATNNKVSQSVAHLHVHVVPRRRGDGLRGFFWPRHGYESPEVRRGIAAKIRAGFDAA